MDRSATRTLGQYILASALILAITPRVMDIVGAPSPGRFQAVNVDGGHQLLVDTQSGRTWSRFVPPNQGTVVWHLDEPPAGFPRP